MFKYQKTILKITNNDEIESIYLFKSYLKGQTTENSDH